MNRMFFCWLFPPFRNIILPRICARFAQTFTLIVNIWVFLSIFRRYHVYIDYNDRLFCVLRGFITTQRIIHPLFLRGFRIANILAHALVDAPCHWLWCVSHHDLLPRASIAWFCYHQLNHSMPFPNIYPTQIQTNDTAAPIRKLIIFHPFFFQPTAFPV